MFLSLLRTPSVLRAAGIYLGQKDDWYSEKPKDIFIRSSSIPDVSLLYHRTLRDTPLQRNRDINDAYETFAVLLQRHLDPSSSSYPNWFAIGRHASGQVGRVLNMCSTAITALERPYVRLEDIQNTVSTALHASHEEGVLSNPHTLRITLLRMMDLASAEHPTSWLNTFLFLAGDAIRWVGLEIGWLTHARPLYSAHFLKNMFQTLEHMLSDGNIAIVQDLGQAMEMYLKLQSTYVHLPEEVLRDLHLPGTSEEGSRRVFKQATYALNTEEQVPSDFSDYIKPGISGRDFLRAACACYAHAALARTPREKNRFIALANNLMAWREQHDIIDPMFNTTPTGETDRQALLLCMTPLMQLPFPEHPWYFDTYARKQVDKDGSSLTPQETEYNWAVFNHRWPAILDSFQQAYTHKESVWRFT
jgi:hypothetical protein